jgi:uncharacterized LabA/DUF88 family protein
LRRLCIFYDRSSGGVMRTYIYVDGLNFYYGAVKGTPYKWLNILRLCQLLLPKNQVVKIKYFTALVSARPGDPDQPNRQQIFLRALRTIPDLEIILGHFLEHPRKMLLANSQPGKPQYATVLRTEEKGSDVNLAAHLINDGYKGAFEVAVLVTNDSDLVEPIKIVRTELNLPVGVLNPNPKQPSHELRKYATFVKPIRTGVLAASLFPPTLVDANGAFQKPPSW